MDLKHELERAKEKGFISLEAVHRIINEETLEAYFRHNGLPLHSVDSHKILSKAPRLFAIHVLLDRGCDVQKCLSRGYGDKDLPFLEMPNGSEFGSLEDRQSFYNAQWQIPATLVPEEHRTFPVWFTAPVAYENPKPKARGSFGFVYEVRVADGHLPGYSSDQLLALKEVRVDPTFDRETVMREVQTLRARRHDYIVPLIASWTTEARGSEPGVTYLNLLFPRAGMNLYQWLTAHKDPEEWKDWTRLPLKEYIYHSILSISSAVVFVHREIEGFISSHHDIKPANILLFGSTWKLADFGRSHLLRSTKASDTEGILGTYTYQPPEYRDSSGRKAEKRHGRAFDVWSLACLIIELLTIATYGWNDGKVTEFRSKRIKNKEHRPKKIPAEQNNCDDSFFNNMKVVQAWKLQLLRDDDLFELLQPNKTIKERETETEATVQPPNAYHGKREHNPLRRAVEKNNKLRIKWLLKKGWAGHPVDLPSIDSEDSLEIHRWIRTARLMKELSWWRLLQKTINRSPSLAASAHASSLSQEPQLSDPHSSKKASQEASIKVSLAVETLASSRSSTAPRRQVVAEDENRMTKLHHECKRSDYWAVMQCLDKTPSAGKGALLTHQDSAGKLPIHYAASHDSPNIIDLLVDALELPLKPTFLVARQDYAGSTPLHVASQHGHIGAIKYLLDHHQDPMYYASMKDGEGRTAQDLARDNCHPQACGLLEEIENPTRRLERLKTGLW